MSWSDLNVSFSTPFHRGYFLTPIDNAGIYHGAPVSVQLLGRRLDEERILTLAEHIHKALDNYVKG